MNAPAENEHSHIATVLDLSPLRVNVDTDGQVVHIVDPGDMNGESVVSVNFDNLPILIAALQNIVKEN